MTLKFPLKRRGKLQVVIWFCSMFVSVVSHAKPALLILPPSVLEGVGTLTNAGEINLGGIATSNITVSLQSANPDGIAVPGIVMVPAGKSNALFNLSVGDNLIAEGNRSIGVEATFASETSSTEVVIIDNDPDHIRFSTGPVVVDTNTGFGLTLIAENADGTRQTNFNQSLTFIAEGIDGPVPMDPAVSGPFFQGQCYVSFQMHAPGRGIRIRSQECPGASDAFTVTTPSFYKVTQSVVDIAWDDASQTLLASIPAAGGTYSNRLVAIDPFSGLVTNAYPIGYDPGQIEMSPDGAFLYVALSDGTALQRFNLPSRVAESQFQLSPSVEPVRFASDFCVPSGVGDSVLVAARDRDSMGNISAASFWRYDNGTATSLPNFNANGSWQVENLNNGADVALFPNLSRANFPSGTVLSASGLYVNPVNYRGGQLFDGQGNFYSTASLDLLGSYPGVLDQSYHSALVEVDPALRRVIYLSGYSNFGSSIYKLKEYDRDLKQLLFQLQVPGTYGAPVRFLRCGSNHLAYVTSNHELWFIRSDAVQPNAPLVDLTLTASGMPSVAVVGADFTFSLTLSNCGPGIASSVRVTNALPANAMMMQAVASLGQVTTTDSGFTWNVPSLEVNSAATLQIRLRFNNAGWQTNTTWALAFEGDPVFTNNQVVLPVFAQLPPDENSVVVVNQPAEDLLYDPARDRLILSVSTNSNSDQVNGLAVFNPHNGVTESFSPLGKAPNRLARSDDGQYLYVSLKQDALVRRLSLPTLAANLEFTLGSESWNDVPQPYYAGDMAVIPNQPQSLVIWRIRAQTSVSLEFGRGIAVYDNGVVRSNVTDSGGNWALEFDTASGTLFGYNSGDLRRCVIDSGGVTFAQQFPAFYDAGPDLKFGGSEFFSSAGRVVQTAPFAVKWLFAGADHANLVEPDAAGDRVFYLVQDNGWKLKVYQMSSRRQIGSLSVPNLLGSPGSLIRWGTNGLAFRTSAGQLCVIRSSLVQPVAEADLALTWNGPENPVSVGTAAGVTLSLTNKGPATAFAVQVTNSFSTSVNISELTGNAGTWSVNGGEIVWTIPALAMGSHAKLNYAITSASTNVVTCVGRAVSSTPDPLSGDNTAMGVVEFGKTLALDSPVTIQLSANDVVWSPSIGSLLLTSADNVGWAGSLVSLDPASLQIQFRVGLGLDASRLIVSRDDSMLYAAVDSGVVGAGIPELNVTDRFLVDPLGYVYDLDVAPGSNQLVVVGSRSRSSNATRIGVYDHGLPRANADSFYSTGVNLEFGDNSSTVFCKDAGANGFRSYLITNDGLDLLDANTGLLPNYIAQSIVWGAGRIYSSEGNVIDPITRTSVGTIAGIPDGAKVCFDTTCNRVFFLGVENGQTKLKAFDGPSLLPVGTYVVPGANSSANGFVRWGSDGFAAALSDGNLVLFRSSLVATNPPADLSVVLAHDASPFIAGSDVTATITISNAGPHTASDVSWKNLLSTDAVVSTATASMGSVAVASGSVSGFIAGLPAGETVNVHVSFKPAAAGILTNQVTVNASSIDPVFTNNAAAALLWIQPVGGLASVTALTLPVKDMEHDPLRPVLYASIGSGGGALADSVVVIDPLGGNISAPHHIGSDPGRLAVSPDGQFLYIALDGAGIVEKRTLPDLSLVSSFPVPQNQTVDRMVVSPTNSDMVLIRRSPAGKTTLHVGGVQRSGELSSQNLFAFSENTGSLFGANGAASNSKLYRINTGANGLTLLEGQPGKQSGAIDLKSSGGRLFFNRGMVVNPDTARVQAIMPVPANSVVEPDAASDRVFYLTPAGNTWTLRAFDLGQAVEIGSLQLPALTSAPRRLLRWGTNGLALYNADSQVIILHGLFVPANGHVNLALKQNFNRLTATTNELLTVSIQLTNPGPTTIANVIVTQSFSLSVTNVSLDASTGWAGFTNGVVTWQVGGVPGYGSAVLTTRMKSRQAGTLNVIAAAIHSLNDDFWGDNTALGVINILGSDANVLQLRLASRDLVFDSARNVIYASTPASNQLGGNLVTVIDPVTGETKKSFAAGSEPDQLALSSDNRFLYVALDGAVAVRRFDLQSSASDLVFPLGTNDLYYALDLEAQPGKPDVMAASLASYNFANPFPSSVAIYDSGKMRTNFGGPAGRLAFAPDCLFGTVSPGSGYGVVRMWPTDAGFRTENISGYSALPRDLKFSNGRLYSAAGQVMDPYAAVLTGTMAASGPHVIDAAADRAFYLVQQGGTTWQLRAFELAGLQLVATQTISNVQGTPGSLIRCGADRLAFRTSGNQLIIVRSDFAHGGMVFPANVSVGQTALQDFTAPTETLKFIIGITNRGFGFASNVLVAIDPPDAVQNISIQSPQGTTTSLGGRYVCQLGLLSPGQSLQVVLSAAITNTSTFSDFVSVSTSVPDPDLSDNRSVAAITGVFFQRPDSIRRVASASQVLAYDRLGNRLISGLSNPNRIEFLNPENATVDSVVDLSIAPTHFAVSDDGQYLYVGSSVTSLVQRIDLSVRMVDFSFDRPGNQTINAMLVLPGEPHALAIACVSSNAGFTGILDDGLPRMNRIDTAFRLLAVSENGAALYGYDDSSTGGASPDAFRMAIDGTGLTPLDHGPSDTPWGANVDIAFHDGLLYFGNGNILNTATWAEQPGFPQFNFGQLVELNLPANLAIFAGGGSPVQVGFYDLTTREQRALVAINGINGAADLTQCGADRVAFRTGSEIIILRSSAIPSAEISVRGLLSTNQIMAGDKFSLKLTVTNAGPESAVGVYLTNHSPIALEIESVAGSQGTISSNAQTIIANIGTLPAHAAALVTLTFLAPEETSGWITNFTAIGSLSPGDPLQVNNQFIQTLFVSVKDGDRDGLPDEWENLYGLNPASAADASFDSDADGLSNLDEYGAGTNPLVFDTLQIGAVRGPFIDHVELAIQTPIGTTFTVETSTDLRTWSSVGTFTCVANDQVVPVLAPATASPVFYRLKR